MTEQKIQGVMIASDQDTIAIHVQTVQEFQAETFSDFAKTWLDSVGFEPRPKHFVLIPDAQGALSQVHYIIDPRAPVSWGALTDRLPARAYRAVVGGPLAKQALWWIAWGRAQYAMRYFQTDEPKPVPVLVMPASDEATWVLDILTVESRARDWINLPANVLTPEYFSNEISEIAKELKAKAKVYSGQTLTKDFPGVAAVGRGSANDARVVNVRWGDDRHPRLALVGKGVCFDSGGLNIKPGGSMLLMKKDMGGAAHVWALAELIIRQRLPICLDVWLPMAENSIGSDAYRPGDVITLRNGRTVEITNTDAEGRMLLADALIAAGEGKPDLIVDMATLTGAARVALGPDVIPFFSNDEASAAALLAHSGFDSLWRLPLYQPYKEMLDSKIADTLNASLKPVAGSITAALFLEAVVPDKTPWCHFDIFASTSAAGAAGLASGYIQGLVTYFAWLKERFGG